MRGFVLLFLIGVALGNGPVLRMATEGRVNLEGKAIRKVEVEAGSVSRDGSAWVVSFPIDWWRWREVEIVVHAASDGSGTLSLSGPWGEDDGKELRQENLWKSVNGAPFVGGRLPKGWESPWRAYPDAAEWPIEGEDVAASWHGRPLVRKIDFSKEESRTFKLEVKASVIPGFVRPKPLSGKSPAHHAAEGLRRGVNLGNCWEGAPGSGAVSFGLEDIDRIAQSGFDHVRVPVGWHHRIERGRITEAFLDELEPILERALGKGLAVVLNWQGYDALNEDPAAHSEFFIDGWTAIASRFKGLGPGLVFELFNEPNSGLAGEVLNDLHAKTIAAIRKISLSRILMTDAPEWASSDALGDLRLPDGDDRIIASFHCYDPFRFTHQGAEWVGLGEVKDVGFDGVLPKEVRRRLDDAVAWSEFFGRPVYLGEFGATREADPKSRARYARTVSAAAEERGIPWCWWEWKAGFGCWDSEGNRPILLDELIGR